MAKQNVLIVDADQKSLRVLEVSLKKAGYSVTKAVNGKDALEKMEFAEPDLVISDTAMPEMDGFELCTRLKQNEKWSAIPFLFLTAQKSIEDKIRGLELGVDDYLNKPIFIREILARVNLAIQRRQKERLERRGSKTSFSGELIDMGILDLLQTIDISRKTGVIHIHRDDDEGEIFFRDGQVINASTRNRRSADAVYRMLVWSHGHFEIEFKGIEGEETIDLSTQGLLMEGMRRLDEWGRLQEQLPSLESVFDVDVAIIAERLGEIPDEINGILKHFDGKHSLMEVVDLGSLGDLEALTVITKLYFEGLITEVASEMVGHHSEAVDFVAPDSESGEPPYRSSEPAEVVGGTHSLLPEPEHADPATEPGSNVYDTLRMGRADDDLPPGSPAPRLSIAVRGLGFVESLTRDGANESRGLATQPPQAMAMAPHSWERARGTSPGRVPDPSRLSDPGPSPLPGFVSGATLEFVRDPTGAIVTRGPQETPAEPPVIIASADEGRETRSLIPSSAEGRDSVTDVTADALTVQPASVVDLGTTDRWSPRAVPQGDESAEESAARIVAALDAEVPPPSDAEPVRSSRPSSSEYFDGESFAKVARSRATPPQPIRLGVARHSEPPAPQQPEFHETWDSLTPPPSRHKTALVVAVVLVLLGAAAVAIWLLYRNASGAAFDDLPIVNKPQAPVVEPLAPQPVVPAPAPAPTPVPEPLAAPVETAADTSGASAETTAPADTAPVDSAAYADLLAKAQNAGRKQQMALLREAMARNPLGDEAPAMLAIALMEGTKTRAEALALAQQAVGLNPKNAMAWLAIGYIHQLEGNEDKATAAYQRCAAGEGSKLYLSECRKLAR